MSHAKCTAHARKTIYVQLAFSGALWYNYLGKYDALNNKNQQLYRK